ncbi:MAG: hypothetical protein JWO36_1097 [Myxococcales bacterium]|nr:hypothetical protein [Myxococcales bacterium]
MVKTGLVIAVAVLLTGQVAAADTARAPARIKVAVVPGIAVNVDAGRVDALTQDLADALQGELDIEATGGLEARRQLPADGLPPDCVTTPACVQDVAKRLGAQQLLFVVMVDSGAGGSIQVDTTWIEPMSGRAVSRPAIDITVGDVARGKFAAAASVLLPDAPVRPKPKPTRMTETIPRHFTLPSKVTASVGVVGLGVAIGFGIVTRDRYNKCNADPNHCFQPQRDAIRSVSIPADIGLLFAVGGAIATGVLFATSQDKAHLVIEPTPTGIGVAAFGSF